MSKKYQLPTTQRVKAERVPNEQLKAYRLKKNWTQVYVATMIGTSDVEVCRWETGTAQPTEQLCTLFGCSPEDLGFVPPAQVEQEACIWPTAPWNVPYRRNPLFTGREEVLTRLHTLLHAGKTVALTQVQGLVRT